MTKGRAKENEPIESGIGVGLGIALGVAFGAALGVVFGDIGTSPIYGIREYFHGKYGIDVSQANVL